MLECGCDEVGRGACVAEVYAGACILDPGHPIDGLRDSKRLTPRRREELAAEIQKHALCWAIGIATLEEVEEINVLQASMLAMSRAVSALRVKPDKVFIDGNYTPRWNIPVEAIIKGDDLIPAISAASIIAKVARDHRMDEYHRLYPEYGFHTNKGYLTKEHIEALQKYGPCPIHRKTYAPVREALAVREQLTIF